MRLPGASLLPHVDDLRTVSLTVAVAVAEAAVQDGVAGVTFNATSCRRLGTRCGNRLIARFRRFESIAKQQLHQVQEA